MFDLSSDNRAICRPHFSMCQILTCQYFLIHTGCFACSPSHPINYLFFLNGLILFICTALLKLATVLNPSFQPTMTMSCHLLPLTIRVLHLKHCLGKSEFWNSWKSHFSFYFRVTLLQTNNLNGNSLSCQLLRNYLRGAQGIALRFRARFLDLFPTRAAFQPCFLPTERTLFQACFLPIIHLLASTKPIIRWLGA